MVGHYMWPDAACCDARRELCWEGFLYDGAAVQYSGSERAMCGVACFRVVVGSRPNARGVGVQTAIQAERERQRSHHQPLFSCAQQLCDEAWLALIPTRNAVGGFWLGRGDLIWPLGRLWSDLTRMPRLLAQLTATPQFLFPVLDLTVVGEVTLLACAAQWQRSTSGVELFFSQYHMHACVISLAIFTTHAC